MGRSLRPADPTPWWNHHEDWDYTLGEGASGSPALLVHCQIKTAQQGAAKSSKRGESILISADSGGEKIGFSSLPAPGEKA